MTRYARAGWRNLGPIEALYLLATLVLLTGAALMAGCASGPPTRGAILVGVAASLGTLDEQVGQAAFAGRITAAKATAILDESARIRQQVDTTRALLGGCADGKPCEAFDTSLRAINDRLLEAQCRRKQAEAKLPEDVCKLPPRSPA